MKEAVKRKQRIKSPKHKGEVRAWRFAVRHDQDTAPLFAALDIAHALRNDVANAWTANSFDIRTAKQKQTEPPDRITKRDQEMAIAERRKSEPDYAGKLHSLVGKNIVDRVDEGWKRFWEARLEGRVNVRPPKAIKREKYRSITYPQYGNGVRIRSRCVDLSMIGRFRLHDHRKIRGSIKSVTMKFAQGRWWCIVISVMQARDVLKAARAGARDTGGDPGLSAVVTFSDGRSLDPPRALAGALARLRKEQRDMSRKYKAHKTKQAAENKAAKAADREVVKLPLSGRLKRQIAEVGKVHTKVANVRDHWHKINARRTAQRYDRVAYEKHGLAFMLKHRRLARAASDRALGKQEHAFRSALGPRLVLVPNRRVGIGGNSQTCICGASVPKTLKDRWHDCASCGLSAPRDVVSANICELIGFGTHTLATSPGRGTINVEAATSQACESTLGADDKSVRAAGETLTSSDLKLKNTAGGPGLQWETKPVVIGILPLARESKSSNKILRKHPNLFG